MAGTWRKCLTVGLTMLLGASLAVAQPPKKEPKGELKQAPKKEPGPGRKEPPKKEPKEKKDPLAAWPAINYHGYIPGVAYTWNYFWPGPVLPGMWGNQWSGLWPYSWWMGGPWSYAGSWGWKPCCIGGGVYNYYGPGFVAAGVSESFWHHGGYPTILPPVFQPIHFPAVSPYWTPYVAPYWYVPAPAYPVIVGTDDRPERKAPIYRAVPASATAEKLFADAQWLFSEENLLSSRDHLVAALRQSPRDARMWYYKALVERAMNNEQAAMASAENGAALEITGATDKRSIAVALERIQGADRLFLQSKVSGPGALTLAQANDRIARLNNSLQAATVASNGR